MLCGIARAAAQLLSLHIQPPFELLGVRHVHALEEPTAVQFQCPLCVACLQGGREFTGIARERRFAESQLLFTPCHESMPTERRP